MLVFGDSLTQESNGYIRFLTGDQYDVRVAAMGGTALCDWAPRIVEDARAEHPKLVIAAFTGNAMTPCMNGYSTSGQIAQKYEADANFVAGSLFGMGVPVAFVTPPPGLGRLSAVPAPDPDGKVASSAHTAAVGVDAASGAQLTTLGGARALFEVGAIPEGRYSVKSELDDAFRRVSSQWRSRGAQVGVIDGYTPYQSPSGTWTKVQPCAAWETTSPLCQNGLIDVRAADFGHFCPGTMSFDGQVPECSTYSPGGFRWGGLMSSYIHFIDQPATGALDAATGKANAVSVSGWAIDPSLDVAPTQAHVYVDGVATAVTANASRSDVGKAFPAAGPDHGYAADIAAAPGPHNVCAYAINLVGPGDNVSLGCKTVFVYASSPMGWLDSARTGSRSVTVTGWAADPDRSDTSVKVQVRVTGVLRAEIPATMIRNDVAAAYPFLGSGHGFSITVVVPLGEHQVCLTAENVDAGADTDLGCRSVTVRG